MVGAHIWARALAKAFVDAGCKVLLVDTNWENLQAARMAGLPTYYGNVLSEHSLEHMSLDGMGRLLALTPNDEVNALAAVHFREVFPRQKIYQLARAASQRETVPRHLRGRYLFADHATHDHIGARWAEGARIKSTPITEEFDFDAFRRLYGKDALPMALISADGSIQMIVRSSEASPVAGQTLVSLVKEAADADGRGGDGGGEGSEDETASGDPSASRDGAEK